MTTWHPTTKPPAKSGKYRAKCAVSHDTFLAAWDKKEKRWKNLEGQLIVFGDRDCADEWSDIEEVSMAKTD